MTIAHDNVRAEIANDIIAFLSNGVFPAILNGVSGLEGIFSIANYVKDQINEHKQADEKHLEKMLWSLCFGAAFSVLCERARDSNGISWLKMLKEKGELKLCITPLDSTQLFSVPLYEQDHRLLIFYREMFIIFKSKLEEVGTPNLNEMFYNIEDAALRRWNEEYAKCRTEYGIFSQWLQKRFPENLSKQLAGAFAPTALSVVDKLILNRAVAGDYWNQNIWLTLDSNSYGEEMTARPECQASAGVWMLKLAQMLSNGPMFLVGPGGMGKSAFVAYLHERIIKGEGAPYERVILLSLNSILLRSENSTTDDAPPADPNLNLILQYIARKTEDAKSCLGWQRLFQYGIGLQPEKRVLMVLDGFNEMKDNGRPKSDVYCQITNEITAFADKERYPYLDLIVTSRVEEIKDTTLQVAGECKNQLAELISETAKFRAAFLRGLNLELLTDRGISRSLLYDGEKPTEMGQLLRRPMYYKAFLAYCECHEKPEKFTQYEALDFMYESLRAQSEGNVVDAEQKTIRNCIFNFFLPIVARNMVGNGAFEINSFTECFDTLGDHFTLFLINKAFKTTNGFKIVDKVRNIAYDFLQNHEQLLSIDKDTDKDMDAYAFIHQDYRDYLAAKYFLQRLELLRTAPTDKFWAEVSTSMEPASYGKTRLNLIYQATEFVSKFREYFKSISGAYFSSNGKIAYTPGKEHITSGYILWNLIATQLSDLCKPTGIPYAKQKLWADTIDVTSPLVAYVCKAAREHDPVLLSLGDAQKSQLIATLTKACECYRNNEHFDTARLIAASAQYLCNAESQDNRTQEFTARIISHNIAKIDLFDYARHYRDDGFPKSKTLMRGLEMLHQCTTYTHQPPAAYRFSCTLLAMILVSPQPYLYECDEYQQFVSKYYPGTNMVYLHAFNACYNGIYYSGDQPNDWFLRLYAMRQLLFLLAEKKVIVAESDTFDDVDVTMFHNGPSIPILPAPDNLTLAYSKNNDLNLRLLKKFLDTVPLYKEWWQFYFSGIISLVLDNNKEKARSCFTNATLKNDIRSKLWLARIDGNINELRNICSSEKATIEREATPEDKTLPDWMTDIDKYNKKEYYHRDIELLRDALIMEVETENAQL